MTRRLLLMALLLTSTACAPAATPSAHQTSVRVVSVPASPPAGLRSRARPVRSQERREQVPPAPIVLVPPLVLTRQPPSDEPRATRSLARRPLSVFSSAPHTHAGLVAWLATLRWPWQAIATCESVRDDSWRPSSSSWARGVFQFLPSTWRSLGRTGDPAEASWREQLAAAEQLEARDGLRAWDCARLLGLA